MRVITGTAKGKILVAPDGRDITRPTGGKTKEGIFSSVQFLIEGADVLDLYAGSGQLGIESLSRGAKRAVFVDNAKEAQKCILANIKNCGFENVAVLRQTDAVLYLNSTIDRFDLAFMDPPYAAEQLPIVLPLMAKIMNAGGIVFCETAKNISLEEKYGELKLYKEYIYGKSKVLAYRKGE